MFKVSTVIPAERDAFTIVREDRRARLHTLLTAGGNRSAWTSGPRQIPLAGFSGNSPQGRRLAKDGAPLSRLLAVRWGPQIERGVAGGCAAARAPVLNRFRAFLSVCPNMIVKPSASITRRTPPAPRLSKLSFRSAAAIFPSRGRPALELARLLLLGGSRSGSALQVL